MRALHLISVVAASCLLASAVGAQSPPSVNASAIFSPDDTFDPLCGTPVEVTGPGKVAFDCSALGVHFSGGASAALGRIGAGTSVSGSNINPTGISAPQLGVVTWSAVAQANWFDLITFTGPTRPAAMAVTATWDGALSQWYTQNMPTIAHSVAAASWGFTAYAWQPFNRLVQYQNGVDLFPDVGVLSDANSTVVSDTRTFVFSVGGANSVLLYDYLWSLSYLYAYVNVPSDYLFSGGATSDFGHTGHFQQLAFFDGNGADITKSVAYSSAYGTQFGPITAAPEPSSLALLAVPLAIVALRRRRRRA